MRNQTHDAGGSEDWFRFSHGGRATEGREHLTTGSSPESRTEGEEVKVFSNRGGVFKQTLFFKPKEMDAMCVQALSEAGLLPAEPQLIRIERFVEKHFECAVAYEEVLEGVLGCTVFEKNGAVKLVAVSPSIDDGTESGTRRTRSTLEHEGGHCLMHPTLFMETESQMSFGGAHENLDFRERRVLCRAGDVAAKAKRYDGRWWEYQANRAIGGLLLPRKLVEACVDPLLEASGGLGLRSLPEDRRNEAERSVASVFDVNPVVARIRLSEMYPESEQMEL